MSFEDVTSVRNVEVVLNDGTQNENEMQVWQQRKVDKTNREMSEIRKKNE